MDSKSHVPRKKLVKVRQACDCCHTRKIRCDANDPCGNCVASEVTCTYLSIPKKKGPKGPRASRGLRVIETREGLSEKRDMRRLANVLPSILPYNAEPQLPVETYFSASNRGFQPSPLISVDIIKICVNGFFAHKYPIMPILDHEEVYATLIRLHESPEQYGLITALCAMAILQPEMLDPGPDSPVFDLSKAPSSEFFMLETLRARQYCDYIENPTLVSVQTSFFLFAALFCAAKDNSAWFYLREATTLLQTQHLHEETTYASFPDEKYATNCRRTFWLLFVTERAYALQRNRSLTLKRTITLPTVSPGPEATILHGFLDLVSLFQNFDDTFLSLWNLSTAHSTISPQRLIHLQNILGLALPEVSRRTEIQQADLLVTRQWLKTMVWQLCVTKGLLSSATTNECMSFHYPIVIARDVAVVSSLLPPKAFEANGVGILEKVFDIGCSLADVLLLHANSIPVPGREIGPRDYLMELVKILGTVLGGSSKYLGLLAVKADECLQLRRTKELCEISSENRRIEEFKNNSDQYNEGFDDDSNEALPFGTHVPKTADDLQDDSIIADQSDILYPSWLTQVNHSYWTESMGEEHEIYVSFSTVE
jgi:hypothetical protein